MKFARKQQKNYKKALQIYFIYDILFIGVRITLVFRGKITKGGRLQMKEGIHPEYKQTTITCACGNVIQTGSTKENIQVEICSNCHPFFTGKQKLVDTGGRVEKFNRRFNRTTKA